jgi:acyl dehydratase
VSTAAPRPTGANDALVGSSYPATEGYEVSAAKIAEFALATGAASPLHFDRDAARRAGHRDVVAPPTFAVVIAQRAEAAYIEDPASGVDFARVVHAEETFRHHRPLCAGDVVSAEVHVDAVTHRGNISMVTSRAEITDAEGLPVSTVVSTLAVRGEGS